MSVPLPNVQQIRDWDQFTIQHEPILPIDLMERVGSSLFFAIINDHRLSKRTVRVFCGQGNNGGDGLVIARKFLESKSVAKDNLHIYCISQGSSRTLEFDQNLKRLALETRLIFLIESVDDFPQINNHDICIDALLGTGISKPVQGLLSLLIRHINEQSRCTLSIDLPSGMFVDKSSIPDDCIKAHYTYTIHCKKPCLLHAENSLYSGVVKTVDIQLHPGFLQNKMFKYFLTVQSDIVLKYRNDFAHKGQLGHVLLLAGCKGKSGAAVLAAKACLRMGAGLTTLVTDSATAFITLCHAPEVMTLNTSELNNLDFKNKQYTMAAGPGMGFGTDAIQALTDILESIQSPVVLDADALTILSKQPGLIQKLPHNSILTPHCKEFDRLFKHDGNDFTRVEKALELTLQYKIIIVLKGHYTLVAFQGKGYYNQTGNAGMAKGGSGDVLTGMIVSMLAQGYQPFEAARYAVFMHGQAADKAVKKIAIEALIASDIIEHITDTFTENKVSLKHE
jgi:NAD(P)H-hydrate epimerase